MTDMIPHAFEDHLIRSFERDDGTLCFIAKDVCASLQIKNHRDAVSVLDEDEAGVVSTDVRSATGVLQKRELLYVTESGLYTLILRSRKAVTPGSLQHRFRRWVTDDLLPTLRKAGHYSMPGRDVPEPPEQELSVKIALVREMRLTFGRDMAQQMWHLVGLPYVEPVKVQLEDDALHPVDEFIAACIMPAQGKLMSTANFRAAYAEWAEANNKPSLNMTVIGRRVKKAGIRKTRPTGDSRYYYYKDIDLIVGGEQ